MQGKITTILLLLLGLMWRPEVRAQQQCPYHFAVKRELVYLGGGGLTIGLGEYLRSRMPELTFMDLRVNEINSFDRIATTFSSEKARTLSDYNLYLSVGLSGLLFLEKETRRDFAKLAILFTETMAINGGLTNISKSIFQRPRPYVFDENWDPVRILSSNDRAAFVSGHTSGSAAGTFFFARVFSDYYPDSKLKPYVWSLAAGLPALSGYLRIRAGKHYPTDVIAGYLLGASTGYFVPMLHKKPLKVKGLSIAPTGNGLYLSYRW